MKYYSTTVALLCIAGLLSACGGDGGGSDSSSDVTTSVDTTSTDAEASADYSPIVGLYDTSSGGDKQYYHIDTKGELTAYDYLGDGVDAGDNCYQVPGDGKPNAQISGVTLTALDNGNYSIDVEGTDVTFEMSGSEIDRISAGGISAGGTLSITVNGVALRLTNQTASDISIDDINSMICE